VQAAFCSGPTPGVVQKLTRCIREFSYGTSDWIQKITQSSRRLLRSRRRNAYSAEAAPLRKQLAGALSESDFGAFAGLA
jgi:hypothetical protein